MVTTYQTLEHVNDVQKCLEECLRVTKIGGGIHIICPDYRSTFEGHYLLPWLPLLPLKIAKTYAKFCGKNPGYLDTLNYTTSRMIRKNLIKNEIVEKIYENDDILFSMIASFDMNTELKPHRDPNIYREPYKRIQIPLEIPDNEKCYMIWKGKKIHWSVGEPQVFEVMDYIHEGYNLSNDSMKFLFIDVKKETQVEIK